MQIFNKTQHPMPQYKSAASFSLQLIFYSPPTLFVAVCPCCPCVVIQSFTHVHFIFFFKLFSEQIIVQTACISFCLFLKKELFFCTWLHLIPWVSFADSRWFGEQFRDQLGDGVAVTSCSMWTTVASQSCSTVWKPKWLQRSWLQDSKLCCPNTTTICELYRLCVGLNQPYSSSFHYMFSTTPL